MPVSPSSPTPPNPLNPELMAKNMWIIWGALCGSLFIYAALPYFGAFPAPAESDLSSRLPLLYVLVAFGLTELLGQYFAAGLIARRTKNLFAYFVIRWAIMESVALWGLISFPLLGDISITLNFIGVALLAMLSLPPSARQRDTFEQFLQQS